MWRYRRITPSIDDIPYAAERHFMCPLQWLQFDAINVDDSKCAKFKDYIHNWGLCTDVTHYITCTWWNNRKECWRIYQEWSSQYVEV